MDSLRPPTLLVLALASSLALGTRPAVAQAHCTGQINCVIASEQTVTVGEGATITIGAKLGADPGRNATVKATSQNAEIATIAPTEVTFTTDNWDTDQMFTITGVDDSEDNPPDDERTTQLFLQFGGGIIAPGDIVAATVTDDDAPVTLMNTAVTVEENGGEGTYTVVLSRQPPSNVTIALDADEKEVMLAPRSLTFTSANWNQAQPVTVTGVDDDVSNPGGQRTASITHTVSGGFTGKVLPVTVTLTDDDQPGVTFSPDSLTVTEASAGRERSYQVRLNTKPSGNVTLTASPETAGIVTVSAALTFTPENWNTDQAFTVTAVDDMVDNPNDQRMVDINHSTTGGDYAGLTHGDVSVTVTDDDTRGVTVSESSVTVTETEGDSRTATYTIRLVTVPVGGDVMVAPSSGDMDIATVMPETLTFTASNWNMEQTVTVTGVDNESVEPAGRTTMISHVVTGADYGETPAAQVSVTVTDDDAPAVNVSESSVTLTEAEGDEHTATYTITLARQPVGGNVTVTPSSGDASVATVMPETLTFTASNWNEAQTVTVTATDNDFVDVADRTTEITHTVAGANYDDVLASSVSVTVTDDDSRGVIVSESSVTVTEASGDDHAATYTIRLNSAPAGGDVTVTADSDKVDVATVMPASLTFTASNWDTEQTVTVTAVDNEIDDAGDRTAMITHGVAGADYDDVEASPVSVTVTDDDTRGVTVSATSLTVTETSGPTRTATYTIQLDTQPAEAVTVTPKSGEPKAATVTGALTFTAENWNQAQMVTVTAVDDEGDNEPDRTTSITHTVTGGAYAGIAVAAVTVTVDDDDDPGIRLNAVELQMAEAGGVATYMVWLDVKPLGTVTVAISSGDASVTTVAPATASFTTTNWSTPQTVTVTAVDDDIDNKPDRMAVLRHEVSMSEASDYDGMPAVEIPVTVTNDDTRGITVTPEILNLPETGGTTHYTVVLQSEPTSRVTITLESTNPELAEVEPDTLVFAPSDWHLRQTVTVAVKAPEVIREPSDRMATIRHSVAGGGYDEFSPSVGVELSNALERRNRANAEILPRIARATVTSAISAVTSRIESLAAPGTASVASTSLNGRTNLLQALKSNERALAEDRLEIREVLADSSFVLPVGASVEQDGNAPDTGGFAIWGSGDLRSLSGEDTGKIDWEGQLVSFHLGVDRRVTPEVALGLSVSRSTGSFEYTDGSDPLADKGAYDSQMTSVHPYLSWRSPERDLGLWATIGYGQGEIEIDKENERDGRSTDASLTAAAAGWSARIFSSGSALAGGGTSLDVKAKASAARIDTAAAPGLEPLAAEIQSAGLSLAAGHSWLLGSDGLLTPSLEAGLRQDAGDVAEGASLELVVGLRYVGRESGLTVSGRGWTFIALETEDAEQGVGGLVRLDPGADGRGLALSLAPGWGDESRDADDLHDAYSLGLANPNRQDEGRLDAQLAYGIGGLTDGDTVTVTPFARYSLTGEHVRSYRLGGRLDVAGTRNAFGLSLEGERRETGTATDPEHGIAVRIQTGW